MTPSASRVRGPVILGVDPGAQTGYCLLAPDGPIVSGSIKLKAQGDEWIDRMRIIQRFVVDADHQQGPFDGCPRPQWVCVEDVRAGATFQSSGRRHAATIGSIQRDFAVTYFAFFNIWGRLVLLAPITKWYPRMAGHLAKKQYAIVALRQAAAPFELHTDHEVMAYGIAQYAQRIVKLETALHG